MIDVLDRETRTYLDFIVTGTMFRYIMANGLEGMSAAAVGSVRALARACHSVLRLHYRSVMANDRRAPYDYFLMVCGPVPFNDWTLSPLGLLDFIAQDGTCRDPSRPRTVVAQPSL